MNTLIQNILVFTALGLALTFLIGKFIWTPKKKAAKGCGDEGNCGCH